MVSNNKCVIGDLGASVMREGKDGIDCTSIGTRRYMSPEFLNSGEITTSFKQYIKNDIYSLSLVSLEILCNVKGNYYSRYYIYSGFYPQYPVRGGSS